MSEEGYQNHVKFRWYVANFIYTWAIWPMFRVCFALSDKWTHTYGGVIQARCEGLDPIDVGLRQHAALSLYYAGHWTCDQDVDEAALWEALRDANGIPEGTSPAKVGEETCQ